MKRRKKWRGGRRPKPLAKTARGNDRQSVKIALKHMTFGEEELNFGAGDGLPAAGGGQYRRSAA